MNQKEREIVDGLHPLLRRAVAAICLALPLVPKEGYRSLESQAELYAKGRTKPGPIVTWAKPGQSPHNFNPPSVSGDDGALACDLILDTSRVKVRRVVWNGKTYPDAWDDVTPAAVAVWQALGVAAQEQGLVWGGSWKRKVDKPHVELPDWRNLIRADLRYQIGRAHV